VLTFIRIWGGSIEYLVLESLLKKVFLVLIRNPNKIELTGLHSKNNQGTEARRQHGRD